MISAMIEDAIRSDWVGRVIDGKFTLLQWLGGTGRSGVFLTELPGSQARKAAIKLIQADVEDADALAAGWSAAIDLAHPHLMRLFDTGRCKIDGAVLIYAVSECADEVLAEILQERALTPAETTEMLEPVVDTLSWLHGKGLVHGRLKPSNILVVEDELKLSVDCIHAIGEPGMHSPATGIYDAPEAVAGMVSPAADVWSLGVTLVEALTQRRPVLDGATGEPVVPDSIPQPFAGIAHGCLQTDPLGRCTLANVKAWLHAMTVPGEPVENTEKKVTRKLRGPVMIAAVVVVVAVIAVFAARSHPSQPSAAATSQAQPPASAPAQPQAQAQAQPPPAAAPQGQDPATPASEPVPVQVQAQVPAAAPVPAPAQNPSPAVTAPAPPQQAPASASQNSRGVAASAAPLNGEVVERVMPDALPAATRTIHGKVNVKVRVSVDTSGNVSNAEFDSAGPSQYFSKVALQAAQKWKFKPAQLDGQAVRSAWILQFQFAQDGTQVTPVQTSH